MQRSARSTMGMMLKDGESNDRAMVVRSIRVKGL